MRRRRILSATEVAAIAAAYVGGVPARAIAAQLGVTERAVHLRLRRLGVRRAARQSPEVAARRNQIYALLGHGRNLPETARALGITYDALRKWLLAHLPELHAHWKRIERDRRREKLRALWKKKRIESRRHRRRRIVRRFKRRDRAKEIAVRLYERGHSIARVASFIGWSRGTVHTFLRESGVARRRSTVRSPSFWRRAARRAQRIRELAAAGTRPSAIARALRVSVPTVRKELRDA